MARASCVYMIMKDGEPQAGFTVKHEMVTWLNNRISWFGEKYTDDVQIIRSSDNPSLNDSITDITDKIITKT